jgi:hypothetical protein
MSRLTEIAARVAAEVQPCSSGGDGPIGCRACDARNELAEMEAYSYLLRQLQEARELLREQYDNPCSHEVNARVEAYLGILEGDEK